MVAFVKSGQSPFKAKTRWRLTRSGDEWEVCQHGLFGMGKERRSIVERPTLHRGWIMHSLVLRLPDGEAIEFHVSRRYDDSMDQFVRLCDFQLGSDQQIGSADIEKARAEFA